MKLSILKQAPARPLMTTLLVLSLAACANVESQKQAGASARVNVFQDQISAIYKARGIGGDLLTVEVPSPGNAIADALMVATLGVSNSNAADAVNDLLRIKGPLSLGVVGRSASINVATVKAALTRSEPVSGHKKIYVFVGDQSPALLNLPPNVEVHLVRRDGKLY